MESIFNQYLNVHNQMFLKNGYTEKALWGSKESQHKRFSVLLKLFKSKTNFSILDLGCGLADFDSYLKTNNFSNYSYLGLEINHKFVDEVKKRGVDVLLGSVADLPNDKTWDYVIASGIYNLGENQEIVQRFFLQQFSYLYSRINIGFAVNFLSSYSEKKDNVSIYHNPDILLSKCMSNFSKNIVLDHSYMPHDFTVFVLK